MKFLLQLLILWLYLINLAVAQVETRFNEGHKIQLKTAIFSNNDQHIVSVGYGNKIRITDVKTLREVNAYSFHKYSPYAISNVPTSRKLISAGNHELFIMEDYLNPDQVRELKAPRSSITQLVAFADKFYAVAGKELYQYNYEQSQAEQTVQLRASIEGVSRTVGTSFWLATRNKLYCFETSNNAVVDSVKIPRIDQLQHIDQDDNYIYAAGINHLYIVAKKTKEVQVVEVAHQQAVPSDKGVWTKSYQKGSWLLINPKNGRIKDSIVREALDVTTLLVSHNQRLQFCAGYHFMELLDAKSGVVIVANKGKREEVDYFSVQGTHLLLAYGSKGKLIEIDLSTFLKKNLHRAHDEPIKLCGKTNDKFYSFGADDRLLIGNNEDENKECTTINTENPPLKWVKDTTTKDVFERITEGMGAHKVQGGISSDQENWLLYFNTDLKWLTTSEKQYKRTYTGHQDLVKAVAWLPGKRQFVSVGLDKSLLVWDVEQSKPIRQFKSNQLFYGLVVKDRSTVFTCDRGGQVLEWNIETGQKKLVANLYNQSIHALAYKGEWLFAGTREALWQIDLKTGQKKQLPTDQQKIRQLKFVGDSMVVSLNKRGVVDFWHVSKGKVATILVKEDQFVCFTPDGYYFGNKDVMNDLLHFQDGVKVYLFDQFDLNYNRPDLVLDRLGFAPENILRAYTSAIQKRRHRSGNKKQSDRPLFTMELSDEVPAIVKKENLSFSVHVGGQSKLPPAIEVKINGVVVEAKTNMKQREEGWIASIKANIVSGENIIQVYAVDENQNKSLPVTAQVIGEFEEKKNLYVVAIGVSDYQNQSFDLEYPAKDARDVLQLFGSQERFHSIDTLLLTNKDVSREKVAQQVEDFLAPVQLQDEVIVFVAGHGILDAQYTYYLAAHDMNFDRPEERGIPYSWFEELMESIPSIHKTLLIDACHSGEIDPDEVKSILQSQAAFKADIQFRQVGDQLEQKVGFENAAQLARESFNNLDNNSGCNVISAASGFELAMESEDWGNGLFTYCLLNGIKSKAADLNKDGVIHLSELLHYTNQQVFELSGGNQTPTSRMNNLLRDIRIW